MQSNPIRQRLFREVWVYACCDGKSWIMRIDPKELSLDEGPDWMIHDERPAAPSQRDLGNA